MDILLFCIASLTEIRELKQTDAAAERRRPRGGGQQANFCSEGLVVKSIQSALDIIHSLIEWRFESDRLLSAAASVCLSSLMFICGRSFLPKKM